MNQLSKFQLLKMYLPVNGYDSLKELSEEWGVTELAIRNNCRGIMTSAKLDRLSTEFIAEGDKKFKKSREQLQTQ